MPRTPINYAQTIIYKIQHIDNEDTCYIDHTTDFSKTKNRIKTILEKPNKPMGKYSNLWDMVHDNGGWNEFKMLEISKTQCNDKNEADAEVFRVQMNYKMEKLNRQFKEDEAKIKAGETPKFKYVIKKKVTPIQFIQKQSF